MLTLTALQDRCSEQRLVMRRCAKRIVQNHHVVANHLERLHAALTLPGAEPTQGVLADVYVTFGADHAVMKRACLELARPQLVSHVLRWFESQTNAPALQAITALATRWSVLAIPSADISTRARRCSVDDSRLLAAQAVHAIHTNDQTALQAFLHHCVTCHDNLAFMLVRRVMLQNSPNLPPEWDLTSQQLEHAMESA